MSLEMLIVASLFTTALTLSLVFLPALVELVHSRDAGPRLIGDFGIEQLSHLVPMVNMEADSKSEHKPVSLKLNLPIRLMNLEATT